MSATRTPERIDPSIDLQPETFIRDFPSNWPEGGDSNLASRARSFVQLLQLLKNEETSDSKTIFLTDEAITAIRSKPDSEWQTPYYVNRTLLHGICYKREEWTPLFREHFNETREFVEKNWSACPGYIGRAELIQQFYWVDSPNNARASIEVLTPTLMVSTAEYIRATRYLCSVPDVSEDLVAWLFERTKFNPNVDKHYFEGRFDRRKDAPLHIAARYGHGTLVKQLLAAGANPEAINGQGETPLHTAAMFGNTDVIEQLLAAGVNVDIKDPFGNTPLQAAVKCNEVSLSVVQQLLAAGADPLVPNNHGKTALELLVSNKQIADIARLLVKAEMTSKPALHPVVSSFGSRPIGMHRLYSHPSTSGDTASSITNNPNPPSFSRRKSI